MTDAIYTLLKTFLRKENFKINFDELRLQLMSHPSYPSLHSITGVLTHFNIPNLALELPVDLGIYAQLPENFIGLTKKNEFILVTRYEDKVSLLFEDGSQKKMSDISFLDTWNGILVATDPPEETAIFTKADTKVPRSILYAIVPIILIAYFLYSVPNTFQSIHFFLGLAGVFVSTLIVKHELGYHSKALDKFCSSNEATSCDAVLESSGASVLGVLKLSDLSIIYFGGISLTWALLMNFGIGNRAVILATALSVPITLYSIYYQYRVVKKWCPLCLAIIGILWLQTASLVFEGNLGSVLNLTLADVTVLLIGFSVIAAVWLLLKPLLQTRQTMKKLQIEHFKFKRNFDLFNAMLAKNEWFDTSITALQHQEIVLGDKNAPLEVLLVTSPGCFYCKQAHTDLEQIIEQNGNEVKLIIRFNIGADDHDYDGYRVASKLMELYHTLSEVEFRQSIHEVYAADADFDKWLAKWGEPKNTSYDALLNAQQSWCRENNFNFTPAILLNGREYPKEYERSDLTLFIEDLMENSSLDDVETRQANVVQTVLQE